MKKVILGLIAASLLVFSFGALANKIIITGSPVVLERSGEFYVTPSETVYTTTNPYYFTVDNTQKVCYPTKQTSLVNLNGTVVRVRFGGTTHDLYCYDYSTDYFVAQP